MKKNLVITFFVFLALFILFGVFLYNDPDANKTIIKKTSYNIDLVYKYDNVGGFESFWLENKNDFSVRVEGIKENGAFRSETISFIVLLKPNEKFYPQQHYEDINWKNVSKYYIYTKNGTRVGVL